MKPLLVFSVALATFGACMAPQMPGPAPLTTPDALRVRVDGRVRRVPVDDYVLGSVLSEVTPVGASPATVARIYDVQSVLARTYAVAHLGRHGRDGFDLCDTTHCQLYEPERIRTSRFSEAAARAVERTQGLVLMFAQRPVEALYHSDCGGHTASADDVWGGTAVPYLTGAPDSVPEIKHRTWQFDVTPELLRAALNRDARSAVGRRLTGVTISNRDGSGRAALIQIAGEETRVLRGDDLRAILNRTFGERAILSTRLSVARNGPQYRFTGSGFGHGVGLCQTGAAARASRGEGMAEILAGYFPGASLARARSRSVRAASNLLGGKPPRLVESP